MYSKTELSKINFTSKLSHKISMKCSHTPFVSSKSISGDDSSSYVRDVGVDRLAGSKLQVLTKQVDGYSNIPKSTAAVHVSWVEGHFQNVIVLFLDTGDPFSGSVSRFDSLCGSLVSRTA